MIARAIEVGIGIGQRIGRVGGSKFLQLPLREGAVGREVVGDPAREQRDGLRVHQRGGQRRHLAGAARGQAREQHRVREVARHDDAVAGVPAVVVERAVDESRQGGGVGEAGVPGADGSAAGLMALGAIGGEVRAHAPFEAGGFVGRRGHGAQGIHGGRRVGEVACGAEAHDLV